MILLKGFLDIKRPPTIKMYGKSLKMVAETKGIHFGTRMNITPHINHISQKGRKVFSQLAGVARVQWGLSTGVMETL